MVLCQLQIDNGYERDRGAHNSCFKANDNEANDIAFMSLALKQLLWSPSSPFTPTDAVLAEASVDSNCTQVTSHLQPYSNAKTGYVEPSAVDMLPACG